LLWSGVLLGLASKTSTPLCFSSARLSLDCCSFRSAACLPRNGSGSPLPSRSCLLFQIVIWQYQRHFPTLEDLQNVKATHKNIELAASALSSDNKS